MFQFDMPVNAGRVLFGTLHISGDSIDDISIYYSDDIQKTANEKFGIPFHPANVTMLVELLAPCLKEDIVNAVQNHLENVCIS